MLRSISLSEFRNIPSCEISFSETLNIFLGYNGQGKSNLLEAISLLLMGESFRNVDRENLIRKGHASAFIRGKFERTKKIDELICTLTTDKKSFLINNKKVNAQKLREIAPVIVFAPESLNAIKGAPEIRRQLIDDFLCLISPNNYRLISDYRKVLRTRNRILRDILKEPKKAAEGKALILSLQSLFLELGTKLSSERLKALQLILEPLEASAKKVLGEQCQEVRIDYIISQQCANGFSDEKVRKILEDRLHQLADAEFASGNSLVGPHKHDISFIYNQNDSRFFCSQGQQRSLILAFKLAQIVYHRKVQKTFPILLLDDVLSELDLERRGALISLIGEMKSQVFLTTTDLSFPSQLDVDLKERMKVIAVKSGEFSAFTG